MTITELRTMLDAATKRPWRWNDGYEAMSDKYADCQLVDADGDAVIPIRIDHHEAIWDTEHPTSDDEDNPREYDVRPTAEDRELIVAAVNALPSLLDDLEKLVKAAARDNLEFYAIADEITTRWSIKP